jgi:Domain of unknown function (DUF4352)
MLAATTSVTGCLGSSATRGLGDEVHDGQFAFTVTAIDLGVPNIGSKTAQGVFVVVDLTVKNLSDIERTVYCQNQKLKDLAGKTYDDAVTVGSRENLININPGKQVHVKCAFDVPVGTLPSTIEVHDSPYSSGAAVQVLSKR